MPETRMKRCSKCGVEKPRTEFYARVVMADGLQSWCKRCEIERVKALQARQRAEMGDEAWKAERRDRMRARRATNYDQQQLDRAINRARSRAVSQLIALHRDDYDQLHAAAKEAEGLT